MVPKIGLAEIEELLDFCCRCKKCGAVFNVPQQMKEALECAQKLLSPKFEIEESVIEDASGHVVRITERKIVPRLHEFLYIFEKRETDNLPGTCMDIIPGWRHESCFSKKK